MIDRLTGDHLASLVLGGLGVAIWLLFVLVDRPARTTAWWSLAGISIGATVLTVGTLTGNVPDDDVPVWMRFGGLPTAGVVIASAMYIHALADTNPTPGPARTLSRLVLPFAVVSAATCVGVVLLAPAPVFNQLLLHAFDPGQATGYGWFLAWTVGSGLVFTVGWVAIAVQGVDPLERDRALLIGAAVPFLVLFLLVPYGWSIACASIGLVLGLAGSLRHLVGNGARVAFLGRFLSPEVLDVVRVEGIQGITRSQSVELSAVYCDLRGFTAYAEAVPSSAVIELLGDYYDALGRVAGEAHATIKDYAGDGVLILVGAPLERRDHADAALALARAARTACAEVLAAWSTAPHPLGLGIGVASGRATVGAIGTVDRMEYTAVGIPINLAARLCSAAAAGEILVDQLTADLCTGDGLQPRDPVMLKGLSEPQSVFALG